MSDRPVRPLTPDNYIDPYTKVKTPLPTKEELKKVIIVTLIILIISIIIIVLVSKNIISGAYHMDTILVVIFGITGVFSGLNFIFSSIDLINKKYKKEI